MPELIAESFAPWSEKARWALDHHQIAYTYREHVPLLGEPGLRLRLGKLTGRVSVPVLITDAASYGDSFAIAEHAEHVGKGAPLMPREGEAQILAWNARSETALAAGRVRVVARMDEIPGAKEAALPPGTPAPLRPVLAAATGLTLGFLRWKYGFGHDVAASERTLREMLEDLRAALAGRPYLLDELSYADIAMAVVLQMVRPVPDRYIALAPAVREVWSNDELARSFADLIEWRDDLYRTHRAAVHRSSTAV